MHDEHLFNIGLRTTSAGGLRCGNARWGASDPAACVLRVVFRSKRSGTKRWHGKQPSFCI